MNCNYCKSTEWIYGQWKCSLGYKKKGNCIFFESVKERYLCDSCERAIFLTHNKVTCENPYYVTDTFGHKLYNDRYRTRSKTNQCDDWYNPLDIKRNLYETIYTRLWIEPVIDEIKTQLTHVQTFINNKKSRNLFLNNLENKINMYEKIYCIWIREQLDEPIYDEKKDIENYKRKMNLKWLQDNSCKQSKCDTCKHNTNSGVRCNKGRNYNYITYCSDFIYTEEKKTSISEIDEFCNKILGEDFIVHQINEPYQEKESWIKSILTGIISFILCVWKGSDYVH